MKSYFTRALPIIILLSMIHQLVLRYVALQKPVVKIKLTGQYLLNLAESSGIEQYFLFSTAQAFPKIDPDLQIRTPWFIFLYPVFDSYLGLVEYYIFVVCDRSHRQNNSAAQCSDNQFNGTQVGTRLFVPSGDRKTISADFLCDSGVEHQIQCKGHPLKRTRVRIPGPLCTVIRVISITLRFFITTFDSYNKSRLLTSTYPDDYQLCCSVLLIMSIC